MRKMLKAIQGHGSCDGASGCAQRMLPALHKLVELPMGTLSAGEMLVHLARLIKAKRDDAGVGIVCAGQDICRAVSSP